MVAGPFIVCESLIKVYTVAGLEVQALQGLDLSVMPGELTAVVGASGSGKSTLLNIVGGLDRPTAGRIWVDGQDLLKLSAGGMDRFRRHTVGFVWQQATRNLVPYLTALENVQLPLTLAGRMGKSARRRAEELLETVDLAARRQHRLAQLSGGEQQRVAIAVALANEPKLLLADEPTGEVDTATARVIYDLFRRLNREQGLTVLIVTHDVTVTEHVDRVVAVRDGRLASEALRRAPASGDGPHEVVEWAVLDAAGRLQVPKDYLARFGIRRRAQLEVTDRGILIRPAAHPDDGNAAESQRATLPAGEGEHQPGRRWQRWLNGLKVKRP